MKRNNRNSKKALLTVSVICIVLLLAVSGIYIAMKFKSVNISTDNNTKKVSKTDSPSYAPVTAKYYAPYTGEEVTKEVSEKTPFMAIIENSVDARPQSGLYGADIVYETMAEGGIPRFIALFQKNSPDKIGPIRSARPYFISLTRGYNLPFAHCGYSEEAKEMIEQQHLMSMNEFTYGSSFWRSTDRKMPHNLYTSADKLTALAKSLNYIKPSPMALRFDSTYWDNTSMGTADTVSLKLNRYYSTGYTYKDGIYYKSMDGKAALDKENSTPLTAKNIVIQVTGISIQSDNLHINVKLIGQGDGYVISNGRFIKMKWSRSSESDQTTIKDESGNEIKLNPGNTWWHIIDKNAVISIK